MLYLQLDCGGDWMSLSTDLISQFVKTTNDDKKVKRETTITGTVVSYNGQKCLRIDGSDDKNIDPIPIKDDDGQEGIHSTVEVGENDRVTVLIKNHTATITGNLSNPSAKVERVKIVEKAVSTSITTDKLEAAVADVKTLIAEKVSTEEFTAETADIKTLVSEKVSTEDFEAETADIRSLVSEHIEANNAKFEELDTTNANISNTLTANTARIVTLEAGVGKINVLIFGSATGEVIQTSFANAVIAQLGDAQIESAMIDSLSADKITAGTIKTNDVQIQSEDDTLHLADGTIQVKDENGNVRVQLGKDGDSNYSISILDENGDVIFSEGGFEQPIIRNDMVSDDANIHASKLDIDSLFSEINGSTNTIKSTKITVDDEGQTLEAKLTTLTTTNDELSQTVESQGAEIALHTQVIDSRVWEQYTDAAKEELSTEYSNLEQTVDGISTTVASHTADIADTQSLADDTNTRLTVTESLIQQLADSISMLVTDENGTSLMTQTDDGWTFSTAEIQDLINSTSEDLHNLTAEVGDTNATVDILKQGLDDLGVISEYVKIGTYEGNPSIELGESDSDFKLLITNTRILFMDGSDVPAYITNKSLYIKKAIIEEELHQGNWVWKARSNGNLGLQWKGSES